MYSHVQPPTLVLSEEALSVSEAWEPNISTWRLQQPFRMQTTATVSSMIRKGELLSRHHWVVFFKRVDRIESSKKPEPVPQSSGVSETAVCPLSPVADDPQLHHPPPHSRQQLFLPACSLDASPCMPAAVPYFSTYCTVTLKMTFLLVINVHPCLLND